MKQLIRKILREQEEEIITAPSLTFFNYDWNDVLDWADGRLFRMYSNVDLPDSDITTLGGLVEVDGVLDLWGCENLLSLDNLKYVGGNLHLYGCKNLQSLGDLEYVGGRLDLDYCNNLKSLGNLKVIKGSLWLKGTDLIEKLSDDEIIQQVDIEGNINRR